MCVAESQSALGANGILYFIYASINVTYHSDIMGPSDSPHFLNVSLTNAS